MWMYNPWNRAISRAAVWAHSAYTVAASAPLGETGITDMPVSCAIPRSTGISTKHPNRMPNRSAIGGSAGR